MIQKSRQIPRTGRVRPERAAFARIVRKPRTQCEQGSSDDHEGDDRTTQQEPTGRRAATQPSQEDPKRTTADSDSRAREDLEELLLEEGLDGGGDQQDKMKQNPDAQFHPREYGQRQQDPEGNTAPHAGASQTKRAPKDVHEVIRMALAVRMMRAGQEFAAAERRALSHPRVPSP